VRLRPLTFKVYLAIGGLLVFFEAMLLR
jgi:hypothetical protein